MTALTKKTKIEIAIKMVLLDAIEKGHKTKNELQQYMKSEVFENAVNSYVSIINQTL